MTSQRLRRSVLVAALALSAVAGAALAKQPSAEDQLKFGVRMAKRGLWSEALFRFQAANELSPGNPKVLNNLAVAYEAVGRFDDALEIYRQAIRADPGNRDLKRNYSQFLEFYQGFRPQEEAAPAEEEREAEKESADPGDDGGP